MTTIRILPSDFTFPTIRPKSQGNSHGNSKQRKNLILLFRQNLTFILYDADHSELRRFLFFVVGSILDFYVDVPTIVVRVDRMGYVSVSLHDLLVQQVRFQ